MTATATKTAKSDSGLTICGNCGNGSWRSDETGTLAVCPMCGITIEQAGL